MRLSPLESADMVALFDWVSLQQGAFPELSMLTHMPNEGKRDPRTGAHLKKQGLRPGFPDLIFPVVRLGFHSLYIELKVGKNKPTPDQIWWLQRLVEQGHAAGVVWGWERVAELLIRYLGERVYLPRKEFFSFKQHEKFPREFDYRANAL